MLFLPLSIAATGFESDRVPIATTRKMATAIGRKRRRGQREWSACLQTTTTSLLQVQFSQTRHLRLDKIMIFPTMILHTQCNEKWQSYGCSKGLHKARRFTRMIMTRHQTKREVHWWDQHRKLAGVARSYMVRVHAVENKLRNRVTTTGKAKASWVRRQGWRRKLVIICHTTDIVCSFHCQIIDCYDLNEWLTIVRYNRFSPTCNVSIVPRQNESHGWRHF